MDTGVHDAWPGIAGASPCSLGELLQAGEVHGAADLE